jgi:hypothetical protein
MSDKLELPDEVVKAIEDGSVVKEMMLARGEDVITDDGRQAFTLHMTLEVLFTILEALTLTIKHSDGYKKFNSEEVYRMLWIVFGSVKVEDNGV